MKSAVKIGLVVVASFQLMACSEECTEETLRAKSVELTEKMQEAATSGDLSKIMGMAQKMAKFKKLSGDDANLQAACEAVDELLSDL